MSLRESPTGRTENHGDSQETREGEPRGAETTEGKAEVGEGRNTDAQR